MRNVNIVCGTEYIVRKYVKCYVNVRKCPVLVKSMGINLNSLLNLLTSNVSVFMRIFFQFEILFPEKEAWIMKR